MLLLAAPIARAQFPSPIFAGLTVQGTTNTSTLNASGLSSLGGGGQLIGTFSGPTLLSSVQPTLINKTIAGLPGSAAPGTEFWATDCPNGGDGSPTGCVYKANDAGVLVAWPYPPAGTVVTIGGQALLWGGVTTNQGNGPKILTCTGTFVPGNALTTSASGACQDSGVVPSGGGGGSGVVTNCTTAGTAAYYPAAGTSVACPTVLNNSLWGSNGSGVMTAFTTLPSTLTAPSWVLSNPNITGTATVAAATFTSALTLAASAAGGATLTIPQGVAPTAPANGNLWTTSAGLFGRFNGAAPVGPYIGLAQLSATAPIVDTAGVFSCPACLTATGGALTTTAPIVLVGNALSLGTTIVPIEMLWDGNTNVTAQTYGLPESWPWAAGTIDSVTYHTGGSSSPTFGLAVAINGTQVTCGAAITVSSATNATNACTALNTITSGQRLTIATSSIVGTPNNAAVQITAHHSNP